MKKLLNIYKYEHKNINMNIHDKVIEMNIKRPIFLLLLLVTVALSINTVSASDDWDYFDDGEYENGYYNYYVLKKTENKYLGYVKQSGTFYKKYQRIKYYGSVDSNDKDDWEIERERPRLVKVKKGDVLKTGTRRLVRTAESKGRVWSHYRFNQIVGVNSKKIKTVQATSKKITGYYRTIKVPKLKNWQSREYKVGTDYVTIEKAGQFYRAKGAFGPIRVANGNRWASGTRWEWYQYYFAQRNTYKPRHPGTVKFYVRP